MTETRLMQLIDLIDEANARDPSLEIEADSSHPKAWLYSQRMTKRLRSFCPEASEALQIAVHGQHIRRWEVPRDSFPDTRTGYLTWRTHLYGFHRDCIVELMTKLGYEIETMERVGRILQKRGMKSDPEVQTLEDVACLVFLEFYLDDFTTQHDHAKLVNIIRKTWGKMSEQAHSEALTLKYSATTQALLADALNTAQSVTSE